MTDECEMRVCHAPPRYIVQPWMGTEPPVRLCGHHLAMYLTHQKAKTDVRRWDVRVIR